MKPDSIPCALPGSSAANSLKYDCVRCSISRSMVTRCSWPSDLPGLLASSGSVPQVMSCTRTKDSSRTGSRSLPALRSDTFRIAAQDRHKAQRLSEEVPAVRLSDQLPVQRSMSAGKCLPTGEQFRSPDSPLPPERAVMSSKRLLSVPSFHAFDPDLHGRPGSSNFSICRQCARSLQAVIERRGRRRSKAPDLLPRHVEWHEEDGRRSPRRRDDAELAQGVLHGGPAGPEPIIAEQIGEHVTQAENENADEETVDHRAVGILVL